MTTVSVVVTVDGAQLPPILPEDQWDALVARVDALVARMTAVESSALNREAVEDILAQMLGNVGTYDDAAGTYTITVPPGTTQEQIEDMTAALVRAGTNVAVTYDDAAGTLTIASSAGASNLTAVVHDASLTGDGTAGSPLGVPREFVQDVVGDLLTDSTDVDFVYADGTDTEAATVKGVWGRAIPDPAAAAAGQSIRLNPAKTAWEFYTPGAGGSSGGAGTATSATRYRTASATNPNALSRLMRVLLTFTTANARPDGADIRVVRETVPGNGIWTVNVPAYVAQVTANASDYTYLLVLGENFAGNETRNMRITYGDPNASFQPLTQQQVVRLVEAAQYTQTGNVWARMDNTQRYIPPDFATAGTQIYGQRDDLSEARVLPGGVSVTFGSATYSSLNHYSNGGLQLLDAGEAAAPGGSGATKNMILAGANRPNGFDQYESWRREVQLADGYAWHVLAGASGYTANVKYTIRYKVGGVWIVTLFHNAVAAFPNQVYVRSNNVGYSTGGIATAPIEADPATAVCLVIDSFGSVNATIGAETTA